MCAGEGVIQVEIMNLHYQLSRFIVAALSISVHEAGTANAYFLVSVQLAPVPRFMIGSHFPFTVAQVLGGW